MGGGGGRPHIDYWLDKVLVTFDTTSEMAVYSSRFHLGRGLGAFVSESFVCCCPARQQIRPYRTVDFINNIFNNNTMERSLRILIELFKNKQTIKLNCTKKKLILRIHIVQVVFVVSLISAKKFWR